MDRAQAHTLEAAVAALLLLVSVGIALQMTAVTPLSASTSSQHLENQLEKTTEGVLAASAEHGDLKAAILYWNASAGTFYGTESNEYYTRTNFTETNFTLGKTLNRTLAERNVAYNVYIVYQSDDGRQLRQRMIYSGSPSEHAVSASYSVTLFHNDYLRNRDGSLSNDTLGSIADNNNKSVHIQNSTTNGIYNHVRVEVIAWRI